MMNRLDVIYAVYRVFKEKKSKVQTAKFLGMPRSTVQVKIKEFKSLDGDITPTKPLEEIVKEIQEHYAYRLEDTELLEYSVQLAKQKQRAMDTNRIERKAFREHARVENAVDALAAKIIEALEEIPKLPIPEKNIPNNPKLHGIIHISDNHLNEQVNLPHNQFNWEVAAKRLKKLASRSISLFKAQGISNVVVCFTGDLLNSDRRLDEMLSNATNRANACVLAVYLYAQFLNEINEHFNVSVAGINGNESRVQKDVGWDSSVASDNYDSIIYNMLSLLLEDRMVFFKPEHPNEMVINVSGQNVLLIHGHGTKGTGQKNVQSIVGKYTARGIVVDIVISGHIHEACISDTYARSSSLVGSNNYAEDALNLTGRASQNIYMLYAEGGFDGVKVDLQNYTEDSYEIKEKLESYNSKMIVHKTPTTVFQVVI